jgi:S-adenosylmethionine-diacylgycerolhomoserine-N-methlytransferase
MALEKQTKAAMDNMYRFTRHVYDATRKYYLLGRDHLIRNIKPESHETVCEIGCGTARNLRKMAVRYPGIVFYGIDASEEMLKTARVIMARRGLTDQVQLALGFAQSFDPAKTFNLEKPFDKIVFSYALSIIPPWRESIDNALKILKTGGEIHIVDFGGQEGMPPQFRRFLLWWLAKFHVYHKPEILNYLRRLEAEKQGTLRVENLYNGYCWYAVFRKA